MDLDEIPSMLAPVTSNTVAAYMAANLAKREGVSDDDRAYWASIYKVFASRMADERQSSGTVAPRKGIVKDGNETDQPVL